jgi:hypothetical protein
MMNSHFHSKFSILKFCKFTAFLGISLLTYSNILHRYLFFCKQFIDFWSLVTTWAIMILAAKFGWSWHSVCPVATIGLLLLWTRVSVPKTKPCPVNVPVALTIVMWKWWVHSSYVLQLCTLLHFFIVISVMKIQSKITCTETNSINSFANVHIAST